MFFLAIAHFIKVISALLWILDVCIFLVMLFLTRLFFCSQSSSQRSTSSPPDLHALQMGHNSTNMDCPYVQIALPPNPSSAATPADTARTPTSDNLQQPASAPRPAPPGALESATGTASASPAQHYAANQPAAESVPDQQATLSPVRSGPDQAPAAAASASPHADVQASSTSMPELAISSSATPSEAPAHPYGTCL
jgi:hypothetical protein